MLDLICPQYQTNKLVLREGTLGSRGTMRFGFYVTCSMLDGSNCTDITGLCATEDEALGYALEAVQSSNR